MQLRFQEFDDFIIFFKPNGIRMHQVDEGQSGFVEALAEKLQRPLFIVHRLDKETSGLVILAKSAEAASLLTELLQDHLIQRTYYFLTDQIVNKKEFVIKTYIEKNQQKLTNTNHAATNSETALTWVQKVGAGNYQLWKAVPKTEKPHQIRIHAKSAGIPICGDQEHGGSRWFRTCLHASEIEFTFHEKKYRFQSPAPPSFNNPENLPIKNLLQDSFFNKNELFHIPKNECYRLLHTEGINLRADIYADHLWVYDYTDRGLTVTETDSIQEFANDHHLSSSIRHMIDRGTGVGGLEKNTLKSKITTANAQTKWQASEENLHFQLRTDAGFSPGLFLDQKENRKLVGKESFAKTVLNLFSYTAGFSVAAAAGSAKSVTTVDVSKKFLEWSKENFILNNIDPANFEFFAQDCLLFLKGARKRDRTWDLIICDPPSFGRSEDSVWRIEKNLPELAALIYACLSSKGQLLFTCNYEKWTRDQLIQEFAKKLPKNKFKIEHLPLLSLDFNETDDKTNLMKGFLLKRLD